jgi:hypothetical protein
MNAVTAERGHDAQRLAVTMRRLADQALAHPGPSPERGHVRLGPGLVHEDAAPRVNAPLPRLPLLAPAGDLWPILFAGAQAFF